MRLENFRIIFRFIIEKREKRDVNTIELYWIVWGRGKKQKIESLGILELGWR